MATKFSVQVISDRAKEKKKVLDAGCGKGDLACYIALQNPQSIVWGYDPLQDEIRKADKLKRTHNIRNVRFSVASHDDFSYPCQMNMIYTSGSLAEKGPELVRFEDYMDVVYRRFLRFSEMLMANGIYAVTWRSTPTADNQLISLAESAGLKYLDRKEGSILTEIHNGTTLVILNPPLIETYFEFEKIGV